VKSMKRTRKIQRFISIRWSISTT